MSSLLDIYLDEVTAQLDALPVKRRTEELREVRQHLLNAVTVNKELVQSKEDAAANAVLQFGTPQDLGENLVWAWRREQTLNRRSLVGAALITPLMVCLGFLFMNLGFGLLALTLPHEFMIYLGRHPVYAADFVRGTFLLTFGIAGLFAGNLFPRRAMQGVCLGLAVFWIGWAFQSGVGQLLALTSVEGLTRQERGEWILSAVVSAWLGSRWRLAWNERKWLVQG